MIPWVWIIVAAWAGGVTIGLLNAVGVHTIAGGSRFAFQYYFFVFAWPLSVPFLILTAHFQNGVFDPKVRSTFRYLADVEDQPEKSKPEVAYVADVFQVCETCRALLKEPYEYVLPPTACSECLARIKAWQDNEVTRQRERFARLCAPCREGLGIE